MKILLTGFDPFGGEKMNPALQAVRLTQAPDGITLIKLEVPTVFGKSLSCVTDAIERYHPDSVVCVGQAGGRSAVTPERVAINIMDATIADNEGTVPVDQPVIPGGDAAIFSTLPIKAMVAAMERSGIPAAVSNSAGTFVCNQLMYGVLDYCRRNCPSTTAGFIHVPFLPEQTVDRPQYPSLSLPRIVTALEAALTALFPSE